MYMSGGQQTNQHSLHDVILSDDDFSNLTPHGVQTIYRELKCRLRCHLSIVRPIELCIYLGPSGGRSGTLEL